MKYVGNFTYTATAPQADPVSVHALAKDPDVIIEAHDESIGICIQKDGAELRYFSRTEVRMIAHALLAMIGDDDG